MNNTLLNETSKVNTFQINSHLSLRLEEEKTYIYIDGEQFLQCIRLILNIPKTDLPQFEEISSIDEAQKTVNTLYQNTMNAGFHKITPQEEFRGHCSNIQTWYEHDYDTRLLHSNISFPILRKLAQLGDAKARIVYADEVAKRFTEGTPKIRAMLMEGGYFDPLTLEQRETLYFNFFEFLEQDDESFLELLDELLTWGFSFLKTETQFKTFAAQVNSHFFGVSKMHGLDEFLEVIAWGFTHFHVSDIRDQKSEFFVFCRNMCEYLNKGEFDEWLAVDFFNALLKHKNILKEEQKQSLFRFIFSHLDEPLRTRLFMSNVRYLWYLSKEQEQTIHRDFKEVLRYDETQVLELIYYMGYYDKDILIKKEHFEQFIEVLNANFMSYQKSEYVQDLLSIWMEKFFEFKIATHSNPLFHDFCENIFTLEHVAFVGSVIRDIYGWYVQYAIRRKNRKSLFQYLMKKLPEVETPYAIEILESMIFHIHRHDRWEFWDDWFTTQFRNMLTQVLIFFHLFLNLF
jgi:hypothetical protein